MNAPAKIVASDGWIAHTGGECPLPWTAQVYCRFADGTESDRPYAAGWWDHYWRPGKDRYGIRRNHIIAYRFPISMTEVTRLGKGRIAA